MNEITDPVVDRHGLEVLDTGECWRLIEASSVGRVAFIDAGEPIILPVTHGVHGHSIVFRSDVGSKLEAARMAQTLAFEVDDWDADGRRGWSVLARGAADTVYEDDVIREFETAGVEPWLESAAEGTWIRILVEEISGRQLR